MISIVTKYHGPTSTRGSRISARRSDHRPGDPTVSIPYPHELSGAACHFEAVKALAARWSWDGEMVAAHLPDGYCFTFITHADVFTLPRKDRS